MCVANISWCVKSVTGHNVEGLLVKESKYWVIGSLTALNWQLGESINRKAINSWYIGSAVNGFVRTNKSLSKYIMFTIYFPSITLGALATLVNKTEAVHVFRALEANSGNGYCEIAYTKGLLKRSIETHQEEGYSVLILRGFWEK